MSGELRRPPQLWEQRLARTTSILGVGISSSGDATSIVTPTPPPGAGGGTEPAPVLPPPGDFIKPSTPQLIGAVQGINVLWDGLNSVGDLWPYDTAWVDVHMSTAGTGFTVGTATLQGRLARPGGLYVGGLAAGTTYYFRLQGVDPAGNVTDPSDAASGLTGLTTASDYGTGTIGSGAVSFDARAIGGITTTVGSSQPSFPQVGDIWLDTSGGNTTHKRWSGASWETQSWSSSSIGANVITATQIAAGAVTAGAIAAGAITAEKIQAGAITTDKLTAGTITGFYIAGGTVSGGYITGGLIDGNVISGGTVTGALVQSSSGNKRIVIDSINNEIQFYNSSGTKTSDLNPVTIRGVNGLAVTGALDVGDLLDVSTDLYVGDDVFITGDLEVDGALTSTSTSVPNMRINTSTGVIKETTHVNSAQRFKHDIVPLDDSQFGGDINQALLGDFGNQMVDPFDVLEVTPIQYRRNEAPSVVVTGFLAEDVEQKFPTAATYDDDGILETIDERAIVAALLAVVKNQAATIQDLRSRIEALEA
jgi:hypothetical protein